MIIAGRVRPGTYGEGTRWMLEEKPDWAPLGYQPIPGDLAIDVDRRSWNPIWAHSIEHAVRITIAGRTTAWVPATLRGLHCHVHAYRPEFSTKYRLAVISAHHLRSELALEDGDPVVISVDERVDPRRDTELGGDAGGHDHRIER